MAKDVMLRLPIGWSGREGRRLLTAGLLSVVDRWIGRLTPKGARAN